MLCDNGDPCPTCGEKQLPTWRSDAEEVRACQACGYVDERKQTELKPITVKEVKALQPLDEMILVRTDVKYIVTVSHLLSAEAVKFIQQGLEAMGLSCFVMTDNVNLKLFEVVPDIDEVKVDAR